MEKRILTCDEEELEISRVYKKQKKEEEEGNVDMISHLPEPLLHYIFSFLDIKQAIQTCILSKRWRYFWVSLPTLNFNYKRGYRYLETRNKNDFMDFVDRVLILRDTSNIQKLAIVVKEQCDISTRLKTWILTSVIRYLEELSLQIYTAAGNSMLTLPICLNKCESLTKLVLGSMGKCNEIHLPVPGNITLPRLKNLILEAVEFDKNSNHPFITEKCFPVLETLILKDVHFPLPCLRISFLKLKYLRIERSDVVFDLCPATTHLVNVHLDTPNLISFYYGGSMFERCTVKNLASLVKADICVNELPWFFAKQIKSYYAQHTATILRELRNVEELTLSLEFLMIARGVPELLGECCMQFRKLKCLKLEGTEHSDNCIFVIACFLMISTFPCVETLCLKLRRSSSVCNCFHCDKRMSSSAKIEDCLGAGLSLGCLKFFKFQNTRACVKELKFIELLLKKALVLEKLVIVFGFEESLSSDGRRYKVEFREKVLTFPRASSTATILFR